jgi:hypothetical protein
MSRRAYVLKFVLLIIESLNILLMMEAVSSPEMLGMVQYPRRQPCLNIKSNQVLFFE